MSRTHLELKTRTITIHEQYALSNPFHSSSLVTFADATVARDVPPIAWPLDRTSYGWLPPAPQAEDATEMFHPSMPVPPVPLPLMLATLVQVPPTSTFNPFTALASAHVPCFSAPPVSFSAPQYAAPYLRAPSFQAPLLAAQSASPPHPARAPGSQFLPNSSSSAGNN